MHECVLIVCQVNVRMFAFPTDWDAYVRARVCVRVFKFAESVCLAFFSFDLQFSNNTNNKLPKFNTYSETLEFVENIRISKDRYKIIRKNREESPT